MRSLIARLALALWLHRRRIALTGVAGGGGVALTGCDSAFPHSTTTIEFCHEFGWSHGGCGFLLCVDWANYHGRLGIADCPPSIRYGTGVR